MRVGSVYELFALTGRGIVVITDTSYAQLPSELRLKIGDSVEFRDVGRAVLKSKVVGIEHCDPWTPKQKFAFLLPIEIRKDQIPIGSDIWRVR